MKSTDSPKKHGIPFAQNGQKNTIPQTGTAGSNAASYTDGFPPITMLKKTQGGLPPDGKDMNSILNEISALTRWCSAGALNKFDSAFSTVIGGYPAGAYVMGNDDKTVYRCTTDDNTNDPNSSSTGWVTVASDIASILNLGTAAYKNVGTGANQIPAIENWESGGNANSGWKKSPDGYILQWGKTQATDSTVTITFPVPFPNGILSINEHDAAPSGQTVSLWQFTEVNNISCKAVNIGSITKGTTTINASISVDCWFIAFGY